MKEERFFYVPDAADSKELPEQEAQHAVRVLRLKEGDEIWLMDGTGNFYRAEVGIVYQRRCFYKIIETLPQQKSWHGYIHLAIAPTKMIDRMEWLVEKATEIGVDEITFLECKFSDRHMIRNDRINKIVVSAVKQSRKPYKPVINGMTVFKDFIEAQSIKTNAPSSKFIAHCYIDRPRVDLFDRLNAISPDNDVTVLIGPEGDFSTDEVEFAVNAGYEPVTLGNSRLRTETAGLMAVTMAQITKRVKEEPLSNSPR